MDFVILKPGRDATWKGAYLLLALIRLYFALAPSYLHPDEHFQGPEVIAGNILSYPAHRTWEFTSDKPVRSIVPLSVIYGTPIYLWRVLSDTFGLAPAKAFHVFRALRVTMFVLSVVLEDRAICELVESPRQRKLALLLISSSYVTWTWQVHTFSNSIETLFVLWSLVLMKRLKTIKNGRSAASQSAYLACLLVLGSFNRITFPTYVIVPALQLASGAWRRPVVYVTLVAVGTIITLFAIGTDTAFYQTGGLSLPSLLSHPVITPLNNVLYNSQSSNLAQHGLHPYYQHFLVNIPMLLGPAVPLLIRSTPTSTGFLAAISGIGLMSCFRHQEARFLLPAVPLLLSCIRLPRRLFGLWIVLWILFNIVLGVVMGVYHQGGIVEAQFFLAKQENISHAYWWKTYSPPRWLLGGFSTNLKTIDLMSLDGYILEETLCKSKVQPGARQVLVAPKSAIWLDQFESDQSTESSTILHLRGIWSTRTHLNFDDLDIPVEGLLKTWRRVVGRRGLAVWEIRCRSSSFTEKSQLAAKYHASQIDRF